MSRHDPPAIIITLVPGGLAGLIRRAISHGKALASSEAGLGIACNWDAVKARSIAQFNASFGC
jgi:hypothetical protein